nr:MAG TPA: Protein seqA/DNA Complex-DNA complex, hemimethylated GATC, DNA [Caudoviricetes sp.]DAX57073.1 MAG TPA: Protein seqA/DNA Complex-DNA complex, hemimethylated GATC, DNA [Crassvirales sp.]
MFLLFLATSYIFLILLTISSSDILRRLLFVLTLKSFVGNAYELP